MDGFLHPNFTSPEQECILLKSDIGVDDNDEATTSKVQAGAREESARLPIGKQQGLAAWSTDQNRQFDRGRSRENSLLFYKEKCLPCVLFCLFFPCVMSAAYCVFFQSCSQIAEAGTKGDMSYLDAPDA